MWIPTKKGRCPGNEGSKPSAPISHTTLKEPEVVVVSSLSPNFHTNHDIGHTAFDRLPRATCWAWGSRGGACLRHLSETTEPWDIQ